MPTASVKRKVADRERETRENVPSTYVPGDFEVDILSKLSRAGVAVLSVLNFDLCTRFRQEFLRA